MDHEIETILDEIFGKKGTMRSDAGAAIEFAVMTERYRCRKIAQHYEEASNSKVAQKIRGHIDGGSRVIS